MNEIEKKIAAHLHNVRLGHGLGTPEEPCTISAINYALYGRHDDKVPPCMSKVIGKFVISIQDMVPLDRLNSDRWRSLIVRMAGTGRDHECERLAIIMDWMWGVVLPIHQPQADAGGYGDAWRLMCVERTALAALAAERAVMATWSAAGVSRVAALAAWTMARAERAERVARVATSLALAAAAWNAWPALDVEGLINRLIAVSERGKA